MTDNCVTAGLKCGEFATACILVEIDLSKIKFNLSNYLSMLTKISDQISLFFYAWHKDC
jgi:hypothetical protein